jgi:hypothetical protein
VIKLFTKFNLSAYRSGRQQANFASLFTTARYIMFPAQRHCDFPHDPVTKSKYGITGRLAGI